MCVYNTENEKKRSKANLVKNKASKMNLTLSGKEFLSKRKKFTHTAI